MAALLFRQLALALAPARARPLRAAAAASGTFELELLSPARVHLFLRLSARGDDALRGMLRGCVFGHAAQAIASYDALARADGRGLDDAARAVALAKRMRAL